MGLLCFPSPPFPACEQDVILRCVCETRGHVELKRGSHTPSAVGQGPPHPTTEITASTC